MPATTSTGKLFRVEPTWTGQIGSGGVPDAITTTIPLASASGLTDGYAYVFTIDRVDANGTKTPSKKETCVGVLNGTNFTNCQRGVEGTAQSHSAGAVVEVLWTAKNVNELIDALEKLGMNPDTGYAKYIELEEQSSTPSSPSSGNRKIFVNADGEIKEIDSSGNESGIKTTTLQLSQQSSTPSTPASGKSIVYVKSDGYLYYIDDTGTERRYYPPIVDNNVFYQAKKSDGTVVNVAGINTSDVLEMGNSSVPFAQFNSKIKGMFKLIDSQVISSAVSSVTFSGLSGDTDIIYKIVFFIRNNSGTSESILIRFNGDSGNNYDYRQSYFDGTIYNTSQTTNVSGIALCYAETSNIAFGESIIYVKSGENRVVNTVVHQKINSSDATVFNFGKWKNTTGEVTSLSLVSQGGINSLSSGYIYLFALQP